MAQDNTNKHLVNVIIPMYKKEFSKLEQISFEQVYNVLNHYPITIIKPESLDLDYLKETYPRIDFQSFDDTYFKGIAGYNKLLLSSDFYRRFRAYEYIQICQLDSYVFRDELEVFCKKGYDYIGAPWLKKKAYQNFVMSFIIERKRKTSLINNKPVRYNLFDKVGNGGFSLRKVETFYHSSIKYKERIDFYLSNVDNPMFNEDVFWATEVSEFRYPEVKEALTYAFDKYPKYCYELTNHKLPFGCHGWYKWKWRKFWANIIDFQGNE